MDEERLREIEWKWDTGQITDTDFDELTIALRNEFARVALLERRLQFAVGSAKGIIRQRNEAIERLNNEIKECDIIRHENERLKKLLLHIQRKLGSQYSEILSDYI